MYSETDKLGRPVARLRGGTSVACYCALPESTGGTGQSAPVASPAASSVALPDSAEPSSPGSSGLTWSPVCCASSAWGVPVVPVDGSAPASPAGAAVQSGESAVPLAWSSGLEAGVLGSDEGGSDGVGESDDVGDPEVVGEPDGVAGRLGVEPPGVGVPDGEGLPCGDVP